MSLQIYTDFPKPYHHCAWLSLPCTSPLKPLKGRPFGAFIPLVPLVYTTCTQRVTVIKNRLRGWRFGVFEADLETRELRKHGVRIKLAGQPFQALTLLLDRPGEVISREEMRNALWPNETWGDHDQRLNKAINKVRDALSDSADTPRLIETIPRVGYRFLGSVVSLTDPFAEVDSETPNPQSNWPALGLCVANS